MVLESPSNPPAATARDESPMNMLSSRSYLFLVLLFLAFLVWLDAPRLAGEWGFAHNTEIIARDGSAPVPQDDLLTPGLDASLRRAAALLPADAVCVIAQHAWSREYFRASYILMPRSVWPAVDRPGLPTLTASVLSQALFKRHAGCLLAAVGLPIPAGFRLLVAGDLNVYLAAGTGGAP